MQIGELENLKHRKQSLQLETKAAHQGVQVGPSTVLLRIIYIRMAMRRT